MGKIYQTSSGVEASEYTRFRKWGSIRSVQIFIMEVCILLFQCIASTGHMHRSPGFMQVNAVKES